ncbi:MAG: ATP-binding cassette domain-containing protein, partial [Burkholderiales bacterium]|nr:ATP-binding cassette domain-containing protein [Burkholderiales bacterium]
GERVWRVMDALARVGLEAFQNAFPHMLSGGQQQRVALARAFVTHPPLLLADEPTGSLDTATGQGIIDLMFQLNREAGSTLVLVTHDPAMAERCGRTLKIAQGRLLAH